MAGTIMQKKIILTLRICLYTVAIIMLLDKFVLSKTNVKHIQLHSFKKNNSSDYIEIFFKYHNEKWVTLQTMPLSTDRQSLSVKTILDENSDVYNFFENKGYELFGAYINDLKLDRNSFFHVSKSIGTMGSDVDIKLKQLTNKSSVTLVFRKK